MSLVPIAFLGFSDPVSSVSHLLAALCSIFAGVILVHKGRGNRMRTTALLIYSFGLIFLFSMSGTYHLLERGSIAREVLKRLDHAGIWVLIASTFTPIHVILFRRHSRWTILFGVWTVAITGLVLEIVFFDSLPESLLLTFFLSLGWVGLFSAHGFRKLYGDKSVGFLILGALSYSLGAVIDFLNWPVIWPNILGSHEIFHLFVIGGAYSHWYFIYRWADHPVTEEILFNITLLPDRILAEADDERIKLKAHSEPEIKALISQAVQERYHPNIKPVVRLRYFREEYL